MDDINYLLFLKNKIMFEHKKSIHYSSNNTRAGHKCVLKPNKSSRIQTNDTNLLSKIR